MTYTELWSALPVGARQRACAAFWRLKDVTPETRMEVLSVLATSLRFREKFLKAQPETRKAEWLMSRSDQPTFRRFHGDLLSVFLLTEHGPMIEQFLEVQGIPHRGCFLESTEAPTAKSFRKGIGAIRATHGDWNTCLYLGFTQAQGEDEFWAALPKAIEAEGLKIRETLLKPSPPVAPTPPIK